MGGAKGVKNLIEALDLAYTFIHVQQLSMADGKIGFEDAGNLMFLFPKIGPAFQDFSEIPAEIGEMDEADGKEVLDHARLRMPSVTDDAKLKAVVSAVLRVLVASGQSYSEVKAAFAGQPVPVVLGPVPVPAVASA